MKIKTKLIATFIMSLGFFAVSVAWAASGTLYIKVKTTKLRSAPQHFASSALSLALGSPVTILSEKDGWYNVKTSGSQSGYLHESVLSSTKIVLSEKAAKADSSDVVLAGKGFNSQVEKQYAAKNPSANFAEVDAMERIRIPDSEVASFAKSGGLKTNG